MSSIQATLIPKSRRLVRSAGFSLVEIMVALVIGLLATLVITQVLSVFESKKRATTGTSDAQTNGSMALYDIKRNTEMAGYGMPVFSVVNSPLKNCASLPTFDHDNNAATPNIDIFPVVITDGGAGSDVIAIRYGRTQTAGIPSLVHVTGTTALVTNNMGCQPADWAIISSAGGCEMTKVASTLLPLSDAARVLTGGIPLSTTPSVFAGSIACIGNYQKDAPYDDHSSPLEYLYWIDNGQLVQGGNPATAGSGTPTSSGIVNIQAQYGISAVSTDNYVTQWVNATGDWANTGTTPDLAHRNRIKAVRIAVVARNGELEKTDVTSVCSSTTTANPTGLCAWDATSANPDTASPAPAIDLSANADWRRYRYRVFETIIPLRSMIWSK